MFTSLKNKIINVDESKMYRRATFWNMIASVLNSITSAVLLFFITRFCGVEYAGIFSIASAIAYQCLSLGNFGTRGLHASDVKHEYDFNDYFYLRLFSYFLLFCMLIYYSFLSGYSHEKALIVFSFGLFKSVDVLEDLYHGEYHRNERLDIASILLTFRYITSIVSFILSIVITRNLLFSCIITTILTLIIFILSNKGFISLFFKDKYKFNFIKFKSLLLILIPIVITNYIKLYITNAPKYSIDRCLGDVQQAYFNVLFMPVFVINLMNDIIFRPYIPKFSIMWNDSNFKEFKKMVVKQLCIILGLTLIVIVGGYVIGLTLLEIIYQMELHTYMSQFILLLVGGGMSTVCSFLIFIMTIQREQKKMAEVNIFVLVICLLFSDQLISTLGISGAVVLYLLLNFIPMICFAIIVVRKYYKQKKGTVINE
ncbi:lipopolysaccharide biosynthesis protein [Floccifex sp.]|uniref:lipopolysaccharide biosynthesis protein n=1 Tax=Floccifex sp. TaxID=2815810 RepID=UPI003F0E65B2